MTDEIELVWKKVDERAGNWQVRLPVPLTFRPLQAKILPLCAVRRPVTLRKASI
jgi:hypothetical protein